MSTSPAPDSPTDLTLPLATTPSSPNSVKHLKSLLSASEARNASLNALTSRLRSENGSLSTALERSSRLLSALRQDHETLLAHQAQPSPQTMECDVARMRTHSAELEAEIDRVRKRAEEADRRFVAERSRVAIMERVMADLRRKVALAEEGRVSGEKVREMEMKCAVSQAELEGVKVELEKARVKLGSMTEIKQRMEKAERGEKVVREKVTVLEAEVQSRDRMRRLAQGETRRLMAMMTKYERELEEKEITIGRLRRRLRQDVVADTPMEDDSMGRDTVRVRLIEAINAQYALV